jgi:GNAT superfamily N-acetyltransferase
MSAPRRELPIELATPEDIPALSELRDEQGWHPNARLLRAVAAWDGGRIFILRASALGEHGSSSVSPREIVATVVATASPPVGVIGNVIVVAAYRRRGLARRMMEAALRWQHARAVQHVLLAATPDGRPLYRRLGFVDSELSWIAAGPVANLDLAALRARAGNQPAHLMPASALPQLAALDEQAYGGDRIELLDALLRQGETWLYVAGTDAAEPEGYLILRRPQGLADVLQIGPWVARTSEAAHALVAAAYAEDAPWRTVMREDPGIWAVGPRREGIELLAEAGATLIEDDIVMQLDFAPDTPPESIIATGAQPRPVAAQPEWLYAWLAPMVF